jgi:hypothetical protein
MSEDQSMSEDREEEPASTEKKNVHDEGIEGLRRDFDLEGIVGNMLISQHQAEILKSRAADRLDGWWLSQARDRNSSSFSFQKRGQVFKVSLNVSDFYSNDENYQQS